MLRGLLRHGPTMTPRVLIRSATAPQHSNVGRGIPSAQCRLFSLSSSAGDKPLPPRLKVHDADLTISYLKGSGPGGQKINKTNSAVQIIHHPTGLVVKSQATRSQSQNENIARRLLVDRVEELEKGEQSRNAIKADRARKKKASKVKKSRRKYRELDPEKIENENDVEGDREEAVDSPAEDATEQQTQGR